MIIKCIYIIINYEVIEGKGIFYRTVVRLVVLYETECWTVKNQHKHTLSIVEMRMLR